MTVIDPLPPALMVEQTKKDYKGQALINLLTDNDQIINIKNETNAKYIWEAFEAYT